MSLDAQWLIGILALFVRSSAMLLVSPIFGGTVTPRLRVLFAAVLAMSLAPTMHEVLPSVPETLHDLASLVLTEVAIGALIGFTIQLFLLAAEAAGSILDIQLGFGSMQLLNPNTQAMSSVLGNFKMMLGTLLFFMFDGHLMMIQAFIESYRLAPQLDQESYARIIESLLQFLSSLSLLSLQIAAPVACAALLVDLAASIVNKAIPQMQVFFLTAGIKPAVGVLVMASTLPLYASLMKVGTERTMTQVGYILQGVLR